MKVLALLAVIALLSPVYAAAEPVDKNLYKPYSHDYPQVIQAFNYETIDFIERQYAALDRLGNDALKYEVHDASITFSTDTSHKRKFTVRFSREGNIAMDSEHFDDPKTSMLVKSLIRILNDKSEHDTVRFGQFRTRGYKRRTIIEFDCGASVAIVESFSNGPDDEERLYLLDLVEPERSFFFLKP